MTSELLGEVTCATSEQKPVHNSLCMSFHTLFDSESTHQEEASISSGNEVTLASTGSLLNSIEHLGEEEVENQ